MSLPSQSPPKGAANDGSDGNTLVVSGPELTGTTPKPRLTNKEHMMSDPAKNPFDLLLDQIRAVVREEIAAALAGVKPPEKKDWMKADELAKMYGMPKTWFEERGRAGDIARTKAGRYVLFKRRDIENYLEKGKSNG